MPANLENSSVATELGKVFSFQSQRKGKDKECSNYQTIAFISHASKPILNNMWTENFHMYKLDLEKAEELKIKLQTFTESQKKKGNSRKISSSLTTLKPVTVWITTNYGKFLKREVYQTTLPFSWETVCKTRSSRTGYETGSKSGKEYIKAVYCYPCLFNLYAE